MSIIFVEMDAAKQFIVVEMDAAKQRIRATVTRKKEEAKLAKGTEEGTSSAPKAVKIGRAHV